MDWVWKRRRVQRMVSNKKTKKPFFGYRRRVYPLLLSSSVGETEG